MGKEAILLWLIIVVAAAPDNKWECPAIWPWQCFNPNTSASSRVHSCQPSGANFDWSEHFEDDCWDCAYCPDIYYVDYSYIKTSPTAYAGCEPYPDPLSTFFTSTTDDCGKVVFDCQKGYYNSTTTPNNGNSWSCVACQSGVATYDCQLGYYPKRCPRSTSLTQAALCDACNFPALPSSGAFSYGPGRLYDDCFYYPYANITTCANFQTPKWEKGWCSIECAPGFVPTKAAADRVIGALPTCRACETQCAPGSYPPFCPGGAYPFPQQDGRCVVCAEALPLHAAWTHDCVWDPLPGYYYISQGVQACVATNCSSVVNFFMGCRGTSAGSCRECTVSGCAPPQGFILADIFMDQCECVACARALSGSTYFLRNCSATADAVVVPCSTSCSSNASYISRACSLYADIQCTPCTPPVAGRQLITICSTRSNAQYGLCPAGKACDGSATPFSCPQAQQQAVNGFCTCTFGMQADARGVCRPQPCPSGTYPDPTFPPYYCQSCTEADSVGALTVGDVMGLAACICPPSYFVRRSTSNPGRIHCWPCGDLGCLENVQRQTECPGDSDAEPTCACALGPGLLANSSSVVCDAACMPGYMATSAPSLMLLQDRYSFLLLASDAPKYYPTIFNALAGVAVLDDAADQMLLLPQNSNQLFLLVGGQMAPIPDIIFASNWRSEILQIHAVVPLMREGLVWVLFRFLGNCDGFTDDSTQGVCWAISLIAVQASNDPTTVRCIRGLSRCVSLLSGVSFSPTALVSSVDCVTMGKADQSLLLVADHQQLWRYPIEISSVLTSTPPPGALIFTSPPNATIVGVADGAGDTYYVLLSTQVLMRVSTTAMAIVPNMPPLRQIVAFPPGGHIFMAQIIEGGGWRHLDLWNNFVSPQPQNFNNMMMVVFQHMAIVAFNGTGLVVAGRDVQACPIDTASYDGGLTCQAVSCVLSEPCGPYSVRAMGAAVCACQPGYYRLSAAAPCEPCPDTRHYCPGDGPPVSCPDYAITTTTAASRRADCLCPPRMYHFDAICLPCPAGYLCPLNGTLIPIPCGAACPTCVEGASSPLQCMCPPRTHGLACAACDDMEDCSSQPTKYPVMVLEVQGWAPSWASDHLQECLQASTAAFVPYSVLGTTLGNNDLSSSTSEQMFWSWLVLVQHLTATGTTIKQSTDADVVANITECLALYAFSDLRVAIQSTTTLDIHEPDPYGGRYEWNGDTANPLPVCMAGYEELEILRVFGTQMHCFPCLNGTKRTRRDANPLCTPCTRPHTRAPYLGMSACVCDAGYSLDSTDTCQPLPLQEDTGAPWFAGVPPLMAASVAGGLGLLFLLFSVLLARQFVAR